MGEDNRTLGLDLGPNSIGWALVDEESHQIVATGVRVFPEGVDNFDTKKEKPKNEDRRNARAMRRQIARRARRRRRVREGLVAAGLLPADLATFNAVLESNSYELRRRGLDSPLTPHELGRVIYHLGQRRGFLSNRKSDRKKESETKGLLGEMSKLAEEIQASSRTLGEYLANRQGDHTARIRTLHTRREMYEAEFDAIWETQRRFHPSLLTDTLKYGSLGHQRYPMRPVARDTAHSLLDQVGLHGLVFFQRRLRPVPRSVVGRCELEPKERRCAKADRLAQRFRMLQEVNNLRYIEPHSGDECALSPEQRAVLLDRLSTRDKMTFGEVRDALGFLETVRFNLESGHRKKLLGHVTDALLSHKRVFSNDWHKKSDSQKDAIVQAVLDLDDRELNERAVSEWGLSSESAERLLAVDLPAGYLNLSRRALEKLVPHMERGLLYMTDDDTPSALSEAGYLRPDQRPSTVCDELPPPPDVANPVVRHALFEVRKVVNAIIREFGKPARIHIELARNAKASAEERQRLSKEMSEREAEKDAAADEIRRYGCRVTGDAIDRYRLWQEQGEQCAYCAKPISPAQLLGGEADVDHILPSSRCLDNSFQNRVVVCVACNRQGKGNQTPYEWLAERDPERYEKICEWARNKLPYQKYKRFRQKTLDLDKFVQRQLNDTRYISRVVLQYVRCLLAAPQNAFGLKGEQTRTLRQHWGLNKVLRHDELDVKNRDDHRHHAVDAIIVALTNQQRLHQLAEIDRQGRTERTGEILMDPWENFRSDVERVVNEINVSQRTRRKVMGALHEAFFYGRTNQPGVFVIRKKLEELTSAMLKNIRDPAIQKIVTQRLNDKGIRVDGSNNDEDDQDSSSRTFPKDVWREPLLMPSGVAIKRVRVLRHDDTIQAIRGGSQCVKPGSNHHLEIVKAIEGKNKGRLLATVITMFEAGRRARAGERIIKRDHGPEFEFVYSLAIGESVMLETDAGARLCVVQKLSGPPVLAQRPFDIHLRLHTDARRKGKTKAFARVRTLRKLALRKVTVDFLGRVRWAND